MPRIVTWIAALALSLVLAALAFGAESWDGWATCHTYIGNQLAVKVCQHPKSHEMEKARALDVVLTLAAAFKVDEPMYITVIMLSPGDTGPRIHGFYDPITKTAFVSAHPALTENYELYYTFAHETAHVILDLRGVHISKQHCILYTGYEMATVEQLLTAWGSTSEYQQPKQPSGYCA